MPQLANAELTARIEEDKKRHQFDHVIYLGSFSNLGKPVDPVVTRHLEERKRYYASIGMSAL
jgi:hypothetical protein